MKRFRKWLIHKLGGYTKEDVERLNRPLYILSESKRQVKRIYYSRYFPKYISMSTNEEYECQELIKEDLINVVLEKLREDYKLKLTRRFDDETKLYEYRMVFEYLEPKED